MRDSTAITLGLGGLILAGLGAFAVKMSYDRKAFIKALSASGLAVSKESGIPLSFIVTQAAHESNWGNSRLTVEANNLFGIKADSRWTGPIYSINTKEVVAGKEILVKANFRKYSTWEGSIRDWSKFLQASRYQEAMKAALNDDPKGFFAALQKAGYATDPAYATKLTSVYQAIEALV